MSNIGKSWPSGWRGVAMIVVGVFIGATLITPAMAHVTSSLTHLFKHTDKRYYKKSAADARFINVGEKATDSAHADEADHAETADTASVADDADLLDGMDSTAFAPAGREGVQSPTLLTCDGTNNWTTNVAFAMAVGFWKDQAGVVHLQGAVGCSGNATEGGAIFTLPTGYTPANLPGGVVRWAALSGGVVISQIAVLESGAVVYDGPDNNAADNYISLDGLTFRAED